ncbi:hypothetical protein EV1_008803 [Malus domestica]
MAPKAVHVSDVTNLDQVTENVAALVVHSPWLAQGVKDESEETKWGYKWPKFMLMGHRGSMMNLLCGSGLRVRKVISASFFSFLGCRLCIRTFRQYYLHQ